MRSIDFYERFYRWNNGKYSVDFAERIPTDTDAVLNWIVKNEEGLLTKDEIKAFRLYFIEGNTLKEVGTQLGCSGDKALRILERVICKCHRPSLTRVVIEVGVEFYEEAKAEYDVIRKAKVEYAKGQLEALDAELRGIKEKTTLMKEALAGGKGATSIDALDLTVRATNALHRKGYHYAADVANLTPYQINHIPNFGRCSKEEVKAKLEYLGLEVMW